MFDSVEPFSFSVSGNDAPRQISLAKPTYTSTPAAERKVMTMVAERTQYANRNMNSTLNESEVSK